jgi:hypothetical protein
MADCVLASTVDFLNPSFLAEFIEVFWRVPCLWKVKFEDFKNKLKLDEALRVLLAKVRTKVPNADLEFLQARIKYLKSCYRRELKKKLHESKSGMSEGDSFAPKLWYFEVLSFLADHEEPRRSRFNLDEPGNDEGEETEQNNTSTLTEAYNSAQSEVMSVLLY